MIHIIYISTLCVYLLPYFIIHGPVLVKDMQTLDLKRSRFHFLVQNDAQYSESNKKNNFQTSPTICPACIWIEDPSFTSYRL